MTCRLSRHAGHVCDVVFLPLIVLVPIMRSVRATAVQSLREVGSVDAVDGEGSFFFFFFPGVGLSSAAYVSFLGLSLVVGKGKLASFGVKGWLHVAG